MTLTTGCWLYVEQSRSADGNVRTWVNGVEVSRQTLRIDAATGRLYLSGAQ